MKNNTRSNDLRKSRRSLVNKAESKVGKNKIFEGIKEKLLKDLKVDMEYNNNLKFIIQKLFERKPKKARNNS